MVIEPGSHAVLAYVGYLEDGTVFSTSRYEAAVGYSLFETQEKDRDDYAPQTFVVGAGQVTPGLGKTVVGMSADEETTVTVPPEGAYGESDPNRIRAYDTETFEGMVGETSEIGLHVRAENGFHDDVTAARDDEAEVGFSHEFVGKTLVFSIEVVVIQWMHQAAGVVTTRQ